MPRVHGLLLRPSEIDRMLWHGQWLMSLTPVRLQSEGSVQLVTWCLAPSTWVQALSASRRPLLLTSGCCTCRIVQVAFARFRFQEVPSSALTGYFNTLRVEQLLQQHEERSKAFVSQLAAACERMGGKLQQLADTGAKAVDGLSAHAASGSGQHRSPGKQRQGHPAEAAMAQLQRLPDVAGALVRAGSAALPMQAGRGANRGSLMGPGKHLPQLQPRAAGVLMVGAAALLTVGLAIRRFGGSSMVNRPLPPAQATMRMTQQQHPGSSTASPSAAVGTVSAAAARSPAAHTASASVPAVRQLDRAGAEKLVRSWQEAKAAALGPNADASGLASVLAEPMLEQVAAKAQRLVEQGWFYRWVCTWVREHVAIVCRLACSIAHANKLHFFSRSTTYYMTMVGTLLTYYS